MTPGNLEAVARQIAEELQAEILLPCCNLLPDLRELVLHPGIIQSNATRLAMQLLDDRAEIDEIGINADDIAAETAQDIICALWPRSAPEEVWWTTPLGRACARSYGLEDSEAVSASVAAAMLGVTRSRVYALLDEGKLDRHPDGGVVRSSVMRRLSGQ